MIEIKTKIKPIKEILNFLHLPTKKLLSLEEYQKLDINNKTEKKIKENCYIQRVQYDVERISIKDCGEIDYKQWISDTYNHNAPYKKDLIVTDTNGDKYNFLGCFPVQVDGDNISIIFDVAKKYAEGK